MWGAPMWTFSGLLVVTWLRAAATPERCRITAWFCVTAATIMFLAYAGRVAVLPHVRGKASRIHFPGEAIARRVEDEWRRYSDKPLPVVGGSWWVAANIGLNARVRPLMYDLTDPSYSPWAGDDDLRRHGGVLIWEVDDKYAYLLEEARQQRFADVPLEPTLEMTWATTARIPPARFAWLVVPPRDENAPAPGPGEASITSCREAPAD
jgi:hypothetical protein